VGGRCQRRRLSVRGPVSRRKCPETDHIIGSEIQESVGCRTAREIELRSVRAADRSGHVTANVDDEESMRRLPELARPPPEQGDKVARSRRLPACFRLGRVVVRLLFEYVAGLAPLITKAFELEPSLDLGALEVQAKIVGRLPAG